MFILRSNFDNGQQKKLKWFATENIECCILFLKVNEYNRKEKQTQKSWTREYRGTDYLDYIQKEKWIYKI